MRRPGEPESRSLVSRIAQAVLLSLGLVALVAIGVSVSSYVRSIKSVGGLRLELTDLRVIDDENPRAVVYFKLHNPSPLPVKIEKYEFDLYLNGKWMGSTLSAYTGADLDLERNTYRRPLHINQVLRPYQHLDLEFALYMYSAQVKIFRHAQHSDSMSWSANATFHVIVPYAREEDSVRLSATLER